MLYGVDYALTQTRCICSIIGIYEKLYSKHARQKHRSSNDF